MLLLNKNYNRISLIILSIFFSSFTRAADYIWLEMSPDSTDQEWLAFAHMGGGYFMIPEGQRSNVASALNFVREHKGRFDYEGVAEQRDFSIFKQEDWPKILPPDVYALSIEMKKIAVFALNKILKVLGISADPSLATGGLSNGHGLTEAKIIYYDSSRKTVGASTHKDDRFITVLLTDKPGLQGWYNEYHDINPVENYFFINIGVYLEALLPGKVNALPHRVIRLEEERCTFGIFCDGKFEKEGFYQCSDDQSLEWKDKKALSKYRLNFYSAR